MRSDCREGARLTGRSAATSWRRLEVDTSSRQRLFPSGFIAPCLPTKARKLPSGDLWLHEIKHDGFRIIAREDGERGIVSKRKGSPYRSGRSPDWLKMKNPACAAVKREEEEDWSK
jgi:ATP-dependent DNA ligase